MDVIISIPDHGDAVPARGALDLGHVEWFLRAQTAWLTRGLECGDDRTEVDVVLGAHDCSHGRWLALVSEVDRALGGDAAALILALYGFCGRVAGSLDRSAVTLLEPSVAGQVRRLLAGRLATMTEDTIRSLHQIAAAG
ncbi:MAG: hypothetical protein H0V19_00865 [Euzebyales bacterium]|nr:hypothetical protein [Euzebyales bacterium]